jgi:transposase
VYAIKYECLEIFEELSQTDEIDVYYGDEAGVSLYPMVPYAWQFPDEIVVLPSERSSRLNCLALLSRANDCFFRTKEGKVDSVWVADQITEFSLTLSRPTVLVLDNASVHKKAFKDHFSLWEEHGLFIFFLPPYSPHLNIVEILWKKVKYEWLQVKDYADKNTLHEAVGHILSEVGKSLTIAFQPFRKANLV